MLRSVITTLATFALTTSCYNLLPNAIGAGEPTQEAAANSEASESTESRTAFWIFLTTGKSSTGTEKPELEKMQARHIDNFRRLAGEGKLFVAGPMADPSRRLRGIVGVHAEGVEQLTDYFKPDPFVQNGFLTLDAIPMHVGLGKFRVELNTESMEEYRFVLLEKTATDTAPLGENELQENLAYCHSIADSQRLLFAAKLQDSQHVREAIMIFRKLDDQQMQSLLDGLPAVKNKVWKATTFPLYLTKGALDQ